MELTEQNITFIFEDAHWVDVRDFDKTNPDYSKMEKLNGTKAIDIIGYHTEKGIFLIEVKDFRRHRVENKDRIIKLELFEEVGQKVKDSLACILAAARNSTHDQDYWKRQIDRILNPRHQVTVMLWMEEDRNVDFGRPALEKRKKVNKSFFKNDLKQKVSWLTSRVEIVNSQKDSTLQRLNLVVRL